MIYTVASMALLIGLAIGFMGGKYYWISRLPGKKRIEGLSGGLEAEAKRVNEEYQALQRCIAGVQSRMPLAEEER